MGYQSSFCLVVSICWQQIPGWFLSHIIKYIYIYIYVYIRAHLHIHNRSRRKDGQWHYIIHIVIKVFYCVSIFLGFATYIYILCIYIYIYISPMNHHESNWDMIWLATYWWPWPEEVLVAKAGARGAVETGGLLVEFQTRDDFPCWLM